MPGAEIRPLIGDRSVVGPAGSAEMRVFMAHAQMVGSLLRDLTPAGVQAARDALIELFKGVLMEGVLHLADLHGRVLPDGSPADQDGRPRSPASTAVPAGRPRRLDISPRPVDAERLTPLVSRGKRHRALCIVCIALEQRPYPSR